jgi:addiction module HigA family antidote
MQRSTLSICRCHPETGFMPYRAAGRGNIAFPSMINGGSVLNGRTEMLITWKSRTTILNKERAMHKIGNIHPGEILLEEFLKPMGVTAYRLYKETKIDQTRISEIIRGKRSISVDTALRFAKFFGNSPEFWINLQNHFDILEKKQKMQSELKRIKPFILPQQQNM